MTATARFTKGLHEIGEGLFAYLQPSGTWGYSNAGLVAGSGASTLVDTLFDLRLTREMLEAMGPVTSGRPIDTLVNTHANGDHCFGNELVPDRATIYATVAAAEEMKLVPASVLHELKSAEDPAVRDFAEYAFGDFHLDEVSGRVPDETFTGRLTVQVGGRRIELIDLGPAHTHSDTVVVVPDARTVFTGDLVFVQGTPIMWAGPLANWLRACDVLCDLDVDTFVPGHGPMTDREGVVAIRRYFEHVHAQVAERQAGGMSSADAAFDLELGEFAEWPDAERIVVTVDSIYRELDPTHVSLAPAELFALMGRYHREHSGG
jgi:glyoxylase-like metal-dependent hydrolase (beta-lactamase superfamily II)